MHILDLTPSNTLIYQTHCLRIDSLTKDDFSVSVQACEKLGKNHQKHIKAYGEGNERRLTVSQPTLAHAWQDYNRT
jgi:hypothetical protein